MASIHDVYVSSDSEDDADYIPPGDDGSSGNLGDSQHSKIYDQAVTEPKHIHNLTENCKNFPNTEPKKRDEDVWNNFLRDVSETENVETLRDNGKEIKSQSVSTSKMAESNGKTDCNMSKKINTLDYSISPKENVPTKNSSKNFSGKRINIGSVLQIVQTKRQKGNVLQNALFEWNNFKRSEGIEADVKKFNIGKQGFLERQRFLQRSELRCFETEKKLKQSLKKA